MLILIFLLLILNNCMHSYYLPAEYRYKRQMRIRRAENYLEQFGYYENIPFCPNKEQSSMCPITNPSWNKITQEEALKKFQQNTGINPTGIIDEATIEMMDKPRCGNSDAKKTVKENYVPWTQESITYAYLNYTEKIEKKELKGIIKRAFLMWETFIPRSFYETSDIEKADIKILFAKGYHGHKDAFDGIPGGVLAHGYPDGRLHFDDDEDWTAYSQYDQPVYQNKDLLWNAIHEIGHVLGLQHSGTPEALMTPIYPNPAKRDITGYYSHPKLIASDVKNIQRLYGGGASKASKNGILLSKNCTEYCFI